MLTIKINGLIVLETYFPNNLGDTEVAAFVAITAMVMNCQTSAFEIERR